MLNNEGTPFLERKKPVLERTKPESAPIDKSNYGSTQSNIIFPSDSNNIEIPHKQIDEDEEEPKESSILIRTSAFGVRSLIVGVHYVGNGLIMSSLGSNAAAASSVATTIQSFTIGASSGFLQGAGADLGEVLGRRNISRDMKRQEIGAILKTGWAMSLFLGGMSALAFLSTRYTLPLVLENLETAMAAADFFETFAIAAIPDLLIWTNGQIVFQIEKNSYIPLLATAAYRGSALGLSYYLGNILGYGPRGVGLGAGIAGWGSLVLFQPWFFRNVYRKLDIYNPKINNFAARSKKLASSGWKHSLQRITEWGNLAIITQIVGAWTNQGLLSIQPSILTLTLCNVLSQGFSQAALMIATRDCKELRELLEEFDKTADKKLLTKAKELKIKNYKNFYVINGGGLGFNAVLSGSLYLAKPHIIDWYIPHNSPEETFSLATTLLWISILSLIPDAVRIISGGILRGWGDLLVPTLASLIIMSVLGIPIGYVAGLEMEKSILPFFVARTAMLIFSAVFNYYRFYMHSKKDELAYNSAVLFSDLLDCLEACVDVKEIDINSEDKAKVENSRHSENKSVSKISIFQLIASFWNEKKECDVFSMDYPPKKDDLDSLLGISKDAYVRVKNQLYYIDKISKEVVQLANLSIFDSEMKINDLFSDGRRRLSDQELKSITLITGHTNEKTYRDVMKIIAKHIRKNITVYERNFDGDRTLLFKALKKGKDTGKYIILLALSRSLNINIIILNDNDSEPKIIRRNNPQSSIYLSYGNGNNYQLLNSSLLNERLLLKIESANIDGFSDEISKNLKLPKKKEIKCLDFTAGFFNKRTAQYSLGSINSINDDEKKDSNISKNTFQSRKSKGTETVNWKHFSSNPSNSSEEKQHSDKMEQKSEEDEYHFT